MQLKKQQGVTVTGILWIIIQITFAVYLLVKLVPPYLQYYNIKDALTGVAQSTNIRDANPNKARDLVIRRLDANFIRIRDLPENLINMERSGKIPFFRIKYEKRIHIAGNMDIVLNFDKTIKVG